MDARKSRGGSSSKSTRGRGRGRGFRPQVSNQQQQQQQYPHQHPYYPQPPPPMNPQQQQYYTQPPPPPPMNPTQYNISMTSDFDPFGDYRDGPSRREASVERDLPLYDDEEDEDVEFVPETQPQTQTDDEVQFVKQKTKADRVPWTTAQEIALAKAWVYVSTCRKVGNAQRRDKFWERIAEHYNENMKSANRTHHALNTKWGGMNTAMGVFNGLYIQQKRIRESGCGDVDELKNALADYNKKNHGKSFTHLEAWEVVKGEPKWLEQPCFVQTSSATNSDKRRKSSESAYYESGSNENADTVLPDLNDDTTPTRKRKGKKAVSEASTKNSVVEQFENYISDKVKVQEKSMEEKREERALTKQLMAAQLASVQEKAMFRAYKFYNDPHDQITNPAMLEYTLKKKRELVEKYGWPTEGLE